MQCEHARRRAAYAPAAATSTCAARGGGRPRPRGGGNMRWRRGVQGTGGEGGGGGRASHSSRSSVELHPSSQSLGAGGALSRACGGHAAELARAARLPVDMIAVRELPQPARDGRVARHEHRDLVRPHGDRLPRGARLPGRLCGGRADGVSRACAQHSCSQEHRAPGPSGAVQVMWWWRAAPRAEVGGPSGSAWVRGSSDNRATGRKHADHQRHPGRAIAFQVREIGASVPLNQGHASTACRPTHSVRNLGSPKVEMHPET